MKKFALVLLAMSSFASFAQSLERDIDNKISRLAALSQRGEVSRLSPGEKMELNQQLASALRTLRDNDDRRPGPAPMPVPMPGPGRGGRRFDMQATALLADAFGDSKVLDLGGRNPGDILSQCTAQLSAMRVSNISQIVLTSNNNAYETMRIFSSNPSEICTHIVNKMKPGRSEWQMVDVSGTLADAFGASTSVDIRGDRGEFLVQCVNQMERSRLTNISKVTVSINRSQLIEKRIFVSKAQAACIELASMINKELP